MVIVGIYEEYDLVLLMLSPHEAQTQNGFSNVINP